jgi:hypothetical protein
MRIPTEPIGSIPPVQEFLAALHAHASGKMSDRQFHVAEETAIRERIRCLEETGFPVITDGEQTKPSFLTYPLAGYFCEIPISCSFRVIKIQHRTNTATKFGKSERLVQYLFRFLRALVIPVTRH